MEASPNSDPNRKPDHCFLSPEVVEIHLQKNLPIPKGTAKLIWAINQLFEESDDAGP